MMPQSIAYASLAGLPAQYGLYTAFIGSFTYVFFGTIKEVSIGPTSLMAILTVTYTHGLPIEFVILLTFIAGCVELLMGLLKLGFLVEFISPCVVSGFTSATALIIIIAQIKSLLGLKVYSHSTFSTLIEIFNKISKLKLADSTLGISCIIFLFTIKKVSQISTNNPVTKKLLWLLSISKNALIVLISSIIAFVWHEYYNGAPFALTGPVPQGLPKFQLPPFSVKMGNETLGPIEMIQTLGSGVIVVPVVAILANVAIAKSFSLDIVDATQEMISLGLSNIFGSFIQAFPSCGAFTRSAVASSSGVRTPIQGIYSGTVIILALSFLAPHFFYIPKSTLAAVLITAASTLFDYEIFPVLWKCSKFDFFITLGTFLMGIVFSVELSVIVGAGFNALILFKKWTRPKILTEIKYNELRKKYIYINPELGLYYPAADYLLETVKKMYYKNKELPIVLDFVNVLGIDYSAALTIRELIKSYQKMNVQFEIENIHPEVFQVLQCLLDNDQLQFCQNRKDLCETIINNGQDVTIPLLQHQEKERKMSLYDNV